MSAVRVLGRWLAAALVLVAASLSVAAGEARASELDRVFEEGNQAYAEGRFSDASTSYQRLFDHGVRDPAVLFNAGNALYRQGRLAEARLLWERALRRAPGDRDVEENLALAVKGLGLEALAPPSWPERAFDAVLGSLGLDGWLVVTLAGWLAIHGALGWGWVSERGRMARILLGAAGVAVVTCSAPLCWTLHVRIARPEAVVVGSAVSAVSGPTANATSLFQVPLGEKVAVESDAGGWSHVSLPNGWHGWVPSTTLARVDH